MRINEAKCKMLHLGQCNTWCQYRLGVEWIENSHEEKDLGVLIDMNLNMTWQCILGFIQSRRGKVILPLYSALVRPHVRYCVLNIRARGSVGASPEADHKDAEEAIASLL